MFITCDALRNAGAIPSRLNCCPSCHEDTRMLDETMIEIYSDELWPDDDPHRSFSYDMIGEVCCTMWNHMRDFHGSRRHSIFRAIAEKEEAKEAA